ALGFGPLVGSGHANGQDACVVTCRDGVGGDVGGQCERAVERAVPHLAEPADPAVFGALLGALVTAFTADDEPALVHLDVDVLGYVHTGQVHPDDGVVAVPGDLDGGVDSLLDVGGPLLGGHRAEEAAHPAVAVPRGTAPQGQGGGQSRGQSAHGSSPGVV